MPSLLQPFEFPTAPAFQKKKNVADALKEVQPLIDQSIKDAKEYNDRTNRKKEMDAAIEAGTAGYEWFNPEDPAHKAVIEQYVRTGDASGIANQRNIWQQRQDRISAEAKAEAERKIAESKAAAKAEEAADSAWVDAKYEENANKEKEAIKSEFLRTWQKRPTKFKSKEEAEAWDAMMNAAYGDMYVEKAISDEEFNRALQSAGVTPKKGKKKEPTSKWGIGG